MHRILISDPLEASGVESLRASGAEVIVLEDRDELPRLVADCDALIVRSGTQVTAELLEAGKKLKVVGRAGVGVDNVDIARATELGILVVNAPTANLLSATEHTFALLLAVVRKVPSADAKLKEKVWDRKGFVGQELYGKTLGIVGLGQIGQRVAARAKAFEMRVLAYDPFLDESMAQRIGVEMRALDDMLGEVDAITFHTPLTDQTRNLLDADRIARLKPGAIVINCGRGGVLDEAALLAGLESGHVGGAGLDVFSKEPPVDFDLVRHPRVVATPHIGAQTREAQQRVAAQITEMVLAALDGSFSVSAVNLPFRPASGPSEPFLQLAEQLGRLATSLRPGRIKELKIDVWGIDEDLRTPITVAALKGALVPYLGEAVNYVNAEKIASDRGIEVVRAVHSRSSDYAHLIGVTLSGDDGDVDVAGTVYGKADPRVVRLWGFRLEFRPQGRLMVLRNQDVPGVVGRLGTTLGEGAVNIADIHLARENSSQEAMAVLRLDAEPSAEVLAAIQGLPEVKETHVFDLGG
ncbi:MAG: phosphoglycerate dehydrogenase [Thermoanaerobaculia bacterium]|nr:phosphoglycerate dehydrogenase [Thermoanaerobaculia bacterium]